MDMGVFHGSKSAGLWRLQLGEPCHLPLIVHSVVVEWRHRMCIGTAHTVTLN
jgi:hypothetical protein